MNLIRTKDDKTQIHILCKDHVPNYAMKNEFQTNAFSIKMNQLELHEEEYYGYIVDEGGAFFCVNITIKNLTNEKLILSKNDFYIYYDNEGPYEPETNFEVDEQFQDNLQLEAYEQITGKFVFIISKNAKKIAFKYFEYYDDFSMKEYRLRYNIQQR